MMHWLRQVVGNVRNAAAIGVVSHIDDTGAAQRVDFSTGTGVQRAQAEVIQAFGFSSVAPADGATTVVIEIGGDPGNVVAIPVANAATRFGGLLAGEVVVYAADGSRFRIKQGGVVEIWGGASVTVHTKTATINAPSGCTINGNVVINGTLEVTGATTLQDGLAVTGNITATGSITPDV